MKNKKILLVLALSILTLLALVQFVSAEIVAIYSNSASYDRWGDISSGAGERRCPINVNSEGHVFEDIWDSGSQKVECVLFNNFDLSSIPSNAVINSAILKIKKAPIDYVENSATGTIGIYSAEDKDSLLDLIGIENAANDINIGVSSAVMNAGSEIGFLLSTYEYGKTIRQIGHGGGIANYYTYLSSYKPKLVIDYSVPPIIIICSQNSNCGQNGFINSPFCSTNDVFQNYRTYTCHNPGSSSSYCSHADIPIFKQDCGINSCTNFGNNYCKDNDVYHSRVCYNKGCSLGACFNNSFINEQLFQDCGNGCSNGICNNVTICTNGQTRSCNTGQLGICSAGTQTCTINNVWGACVRNNNPVTEICNDGLDNDCDGLTDNNDPNCVIVSCISDSDCNDGLFCNGVETCVSGNCHSGNLVNCSANNLLAIATCNNNPDNNSSTWDFRNAFSSSCNENTNTCTVGIVNISHTLEIGKCGVECLDNEDCEDDETCDDDYQCKYEEDDNRGSTSMKDLMNTDYINDLEEIKTEITWPIQLGSSEDLVVKNDEEKPVSLWLWLLIALIIIIVIIILLVLASRR